MGLILGQVVMMLDVGVELPSITAPAKLRDLPSVQLHALYRPASLYS